MNDSKSLNTIITLTKIAKVLSMIVFVLLVIGVVFSALSLLALPTLKDMLSNVDWDSIYQNLDADDIASIKEIFGSLDSPTISPMFTRTLICGVIGFAAHAVVAFMAYKYFKRVLEAGTPFTFKGANELKVLGIVSLCVSLGFSILSSIITSGAESIKFDLSSGGDLSPGIAFLVVSVIFRHGAELREMAENASPALPFGGEQ